MYPKDNVFQIYYNIGKRLPFQVKRFRSFNEADRYSQKGRTFMVERVEIRNKVYGTAYGYCMIDGVRDDNNEYMQNYEKGTVPCAGCGEWVLIDIPGVDMNEVFPRHQPDFILPFGKYKGMTLADIYKENPKYVFWLAESDRYFRIDFTALMGIDPKDIEARSKIKAEINKIFPKITVENVISFGKYKGRTYRDVYNQDPDYIVWFLQNNHTLDIDYNSFRNYIKQRF